MSITTAICNSFKAEVLTNTHTGSDTYKLALINTASGGAHGAGTTNYSDLGADEVAGTGYSAGGVTLAGVTVTLGVMDFSDVSLPNCTFNTRGALIYNSSKGNKAVAVYNFGSDFTLTAGTFNIAIANAVQAA